MLIKILLYFCLIVPFYVLNFFYGFVGQDVLSCVAVIIVFMTNILILLKKKLSVFSVALLTIINGIFYPSVLYSFDFINNYKAIAVVLFFTLLFATLVLLEINPIIIWIFLILNSLNSSILDLYISDGIYNTTNIIYVSIMTYICFKINNKSVLFKIIYKKKRKTIDD